MRKLRVAGWIGIVFITLNFFGHFFGQSASPSPILINGAGATFPYPLYSKWFSDYQKQDPSLQINYQSIGSGGGIRQISADTIDFGATDIPMTDQQLAQSPRPVLHIPMALGAVVLTYHLPGIPGSLKLSSDVIADLFLGEIQEWNDSRIQKLNPGIRLPNLPVILVHRSDGSGTTAILTDYLSKISSQWKQQVGVGTAVRWPVGLGGKGNEGVAGLIKQTPGSIGYVELIFAESNHLSYAMIQNPSGQFVLPSIQSVTAAADAAEKSKSIPEDFRTSITQQSGTQSDMQRNTDAYPISAMTYLLVHQTLPREKGEKWVRFLHWAVTNGQNDAAQLYYAPLPPSLVKKIQAKIDSIQLR